MEPHRLERGNKMKKLRMRIRAFLHLRRIQYYRSKNRLKGSLNRVALGGKMPCKDCHMETYRTEGYDVFPKVWKEANKEDNTGWKGTGYLCIGCLEKRLGRNLIGDDFTQRMIPNNTSERLKSRRGW